METYAGTKVTTALGTITAVLGAAFLAVLSTGCTGQTGGPPTPGNSASLTAHNDRDDANRGHRQGDRR